MDQTQTITGQTDTGVAEVESPDTTDVDYLDFCSSFTGHYHVFEFIKNDGGQGGTTMEYDHLLCSMIPYPVSKIIKLIQGLLVCIGIVIIVVLILFISYHSEYYGSNASSYNFVLMEDISELVAYLTIILALFYYSIKFEKCINNISSSDGNSSDSSNMELLISEYHYYGNIFHLLYIVHLFSLWLHILFYFTTTLFGCILNIEDECHSYFEEYISSDDFSLDDSNYYLQRQYLHFWIEFLSFLIYLIINGRILYQLNNFYTIFTYKLFLSIKNIKHCLNYNDKKVKKGIICQACKCCGCGNCDINENSSVFRVKIIIFVCLFGITAFWIFVAVANISSFESPSTYLYINGILYVLFPCIAAYYCGILLYRNYNDDSKKILFHKNSLSTLYACLWLVAQYYRVFWDELLIVLFDEYVFANKLFSFAFASLCLIAACQLLFNVQTFIKITCYTHRYNKKMIEQSQS